MLGNIGHLFVKCMRQDTKGILYHLLEESDYYVMYRQSSQFCEISAKTTNGKLILLDGWLCELL